MGGASSIGSLRLQSWGLLSVVLLGLGVPPGRGASVESGASEEGRPRGRMRSRLSVLVSCVGRGGFVRAVSRGLQCSRGPAWPQS